MNSTPSASRLPPRSPIPGESSNLLDTHSCLCLPICACSDIPLTSCSIITLPISCFCYTTAHFLSVPRSLVCPYCCSNFAGTTLSPPLEACGAPTHESFALTPTTGTLPPTNPRAHRGRPPTMHPATTSAAPHAILPPTQTLPTRGGGRCSMNPTAHRNSSQRGIHQLFPPRPTPTPVIPPAAPPGQAQPNLRNPPATLLPPCRPTTASMPDLLQLGIHPPDTFHIWLHQWSLSHPGATARELCATLASSPLPWFQLWLPWDQAHCTSIPANGFCGYYTHWALTQQPRVGLPLRITAALHRKLGRHILATCPTERGDARTTMLEVAPRASAARATDVLPARLWFSSDWLPTLRHTIPHTAVGLFTPDSTCHPHGSQRPQWALCHSTSEALSTTCHAYHALIAILADPRVGILDRDHFYPFDTQPLTTQLDACLFQICTNLLTAPYVSTPPPPGTRDSSTPTLRYRTRTEAISHRRHTHPQPDDPPRLQTRNGPPLPHTSDTGQGHAKPCHPHPHLPEPTSMSGTRATQRCSDSRSPIYPMRAGGSSRSPHSRRGPRS